MHIITMDNYTYKARLDQKVDFIFILPPDSMFLKKKSRKTNNKNVGLIILVEV